MSLLSTLSRPSRTRRLHADHRLALPLVIAHRGASGYRPEHTLAAYQLAMEMGSDYVEPDLVSTKDGVLVARHESEISGTTDVASRAVFSDRFTRKVIGGRVLSGWFTEDFTLDELKTLRARERMSRFRPRSRKYDGLFEIATFDEILDLVERQSRLRGEVIGVTPEVKHPAYFASIGLDLQGPLISSLESHHLNRQNARVRVQSFDAEFLRGLRAEVRVRLAQLVEAFEPERVSAAGLADIATYADAVGAAKELVLTGGRNDLVGSAHSLGLDVLVWTLRDENRFLATEFRNHLGPRARGNPEGECAALFDAGVDGVFTDHPDTAVSARAVWAGQLSDPSVGIRTHATR